MHEVAGGGAPPRGQGRGREANTAPETRQGSLIVTMEGAKRAPGRSRRTRHQRERSNSIRTRVYLLRLNRVYFDFLDVVKLDPCYGWQWGYRL